MVNPTIFVEFASVFVLMVAVHYSYIIYKYNRIHTPWLAVTVALGLMTFQNITFLLIDMGYLSEYAIPQVMSRITLPLLIAVFLAAGLYTMKQNFEKFDFIDSKAVDKAKKFNSSND